MIGIIGRKLGMTQIFNEEGLQIPCTVVEATPNSVIKVLTKDKVGFDSVELGFGEQRHARESKKGERTPRGRRAHKAVIGHAAKAGLTVAPEVLRSFRLDDAQLKENRKAIPTYALGDKVTVEIRRVSSRARRCLGIMVLSAIRKRIFALSASTPLAISSTSAAPWPVPPTGSCS